MTLKKRKALLAISTLIFLLLAVATILYSNGYSLNDNFTFSKNGGLYIAAPYENADIFIDNKKEKTTSIFSQGLFLSGLKPGNYSILVAKEGMWPWLKTLQVKEGQVAESRSFLIPENTNGDFILKGKFLNLWASPSKPLLMLQEQRGANFHLIFFQPGKNSFLQDKATSTTSLLTFKSRVSNLTWGDNYLIFKTEKGLIKAVFDLSADTVTAGAILPDQIDENAEQRSDYERLTTRQDIKIWWDPVSNIIYADWLKDESDIPYYLCDEKPCVRPFQIFKSRAPIQNIDFLPQRKDVIIIAVSNGIYALEMDKRGQQNLQPFYKGSSPTFGLIKGENLIYILDSGSLIKVDLKNKS